MCLNKRKKLVLRLKFKLESREVPKGERELG